MAKRQEKDRDDLEALAAEYVVGVLEADERRRFEALVKTSPEAAQALQRWENRLHGLNEGYGSQQPPASIKKHIDKRLFPDARQNSGGLWQSLAFWRGFSLVGTAAAVALALWAAGLSGEVSQSRIALIDAEKSAAEAQRNLKAYEGELAARAGRLAELESELAQTRSGLETAQAELAEMAERSQPILVVSLESGDTDYRFLAVHEEGSDEMRMTLVSGDAQAGKDFELWLVEPDKQTVSLGVISEGKSAVVLAPEHAGVLEKGGLLAVSIEQKGGSPTGIAQGPVVAVGAPQKL
ncbi:anti-sigma factor [Salaquimonas pukyongi]|uniref:anti-sigma factor n=1 Tax=Salaquimonas pukyongi TaxID=2712698 RepID=UPI00096BA9B5|nr:anti-sigma factor [Salaquimonas pukyongi]